MDEVVGRLRVADAAFHAAVMGQTLMEIVQENEGFTLATAEKVLRSEGSNTYLLAAPVSKAPEGVQSRTVFGEPAPYWVWICLHGQTEALMTMIQFEIPTYVENLKSYRNWDS